MQDQASFRVKYDFAGPVHDKYKNVYKLHTEQFPLPKTWSVEPGTTNIGHDHCHGEWIFHGWFTAFSITLANRTDPLLGDRKHLDEAKKSVQDFYRDLTVNIEP